MILRKFTWEAIGVQLFQIQNTWMFSIVHIILERRRHRFVTCFIEQLVPSNNKTVVEQKLTVVSHEMKKKQSATC